MEGILFLHGNDFFDIRKNKKSKFKEMSVLNEDINYKKDPLYYFTEIKGKKSKIYDFDSEILIPVLRKFGNIHYLFLKNKKTLEVDFALFFDGSALSFKDITFVVEDILIPKFGINFFYYEYDKKINARLFLVE